MALAQEGYPNPKDYQSNEKLLLDYTFATGGTDKIKQIIDFLEAQEQVASDIVKKQENKEKFAI